MNSLIVLAHPEPQSFAAALFAQAGDSLAESGPVSRSDLYRMDFDPVSDRRNFTTVANGDFLKLQNEEIHASENDGFAPDIAAEMAKVEAADLLILHFPLFWFSMPAMLKGWVDRVFASGRMYGSGRMYEKGVFAGKRAMLTITTGGPESLYAADGFHGDIQAILHPIHRGILQFLGFDVLPPHIVFSPARMTPDERRDALAVYANRLEQIEREAPLGPLSYR